MIHSTAVIEPGAQLGADVEVGPFSYIQRGTQIGDGCRIGPHVCIMRFTSLGAGSRVHSNAVLGDLPQDKAFKDAESWVKIGTNCIIREGVTVHRGTKEGTSTEIGNGCFLMGNAHFAHNVKLGNHVVVANGTLLAGYVSVGDAAFISGNVVVHQFVKIGRLAMLGGMSGISKDVPPFCLVAAKSINKISALNVVGLRRAGMTSEEREQVHKAFHILFQSGLNISQAGEQTRQLFTSGPALELCSFVESSTRGVCTQEESDPTEPA
jgi:UDP-N-acetylglucosamine acyltransferase